MGPGWDVLSQTGDKLRAKQMAMDCGVPVLDAMVRPTADLAETHAFAAKVGFPVMIKATDGGGGRGIRLVREELELDDCVHRAINESPSRKVFVEKAAIDGFHHIEIQIIGDGTGRVQHLWERDCSAQRRFQKVVECAPSLVRDRSLIGRVIESAVRMASHIRYRSLGTFEFLVNESKQQFYFLEVNPRLQVEHTITESISGFDLVYIQLLIAQGRTIEELGLAAECDPYQAPPNAFSIQLRVCAENPSNSFDLSVGNITRFTVPGGNGIRLDTHINISEAPVIVGTSFDNLLAKIIITATTWEAVVRKAQRVLEDSKIDGVQTNIKFLKGVVSHADFLAGKVDAQWLGRNFDAILLASEATSGRLQNISSWQTMDAAKDGAPSSPFQSGYIWSVNLQGLAKDGDRHARKITGYLRLLRVVRNEFPTALTADLEYTSQTSQRAIPYRMHIESAGTDAPAACRRGDPKNPLHIILHTPGKLVEILVSPGQDIVKNQGLAFVKQMKMELEVRSPRSGKVKWVHELKDNEEDAEEGMLLVELESVKDDLKMQEKL